MESKLGFGVMFIGLSLIVFDNGLVLATMQKGLLWDETCKDQSSLSMDDDANDVIRHFAIYETPNLYGHVDKYYGVKATLSVYGVPGVKNTQFSAACIWLISGYDGPKEKRNVIVVGWTVNPNQYHDNRPHFFTLWTRDRFQTVCRDTRCRGFVLANKSHVVPGSPIDQVSVYNGPQHDITIKIFKDPASKNWWLHYGPSGQHDKLIEVGYFPSSLFTNLAGSAAVMQFGGSVKYLNNERGPPMGSGHFPEEGQGKAAGFFGVQGIDYNGNMYDFFRNLDHIQEKTECYHVGEISQNNFFYGGPAGCIN